LIFTSKLFHVATDPVPYGSNIYIIFDKASVSPRDYISIGLHSNDLDIYDSYTDKFYNIEPKDDKTNTLDSEIISILGEFKNIYTLVGAYRTYICTKHINDISEIPSVKQY